MNKINFKKLTPALCAAIASAVILSGCSGNNSDGNPDGTLSDTSSGGNDTTSVYIDPEKDLQEDFTVTSLVLAEGDDYAINKINPTAEGELPGGLSLQDYTEEMQGKLYNNGKSKIIIRAYNYKENLQAMDIWADNACAMMRMANITSACDTVFGEPENVKVCGFDGIKYDYEIIQYDFIKNENDPEAEPVKTELYRYKARVYYFYSEQDAYVITFDTREEDWEEQSAYFEEFVAGLEVTKAEY